MSLQDRSTPPTVVVVEDNPEIAALMAYVLTRKGCRVVTAATGAEGLETIRREGPDLAVIERELPFSSGEELVQTIRADDGCGSLPILVIVNSGATEATARVLALGEDVLHKPFAPDEFADRCLQKLKETASPRYEQGRSPLHEAAADQDEDLCRALLDAGFTPDARDRHGWSVLHVAAYYGYEGAGVVDLLLDAGAPPDGDNGRGTTPLHIAARRGNVSVCEALIMRGVDVDSRNEFGLTALEECRRHRHEEIESLLTAAGARGSSGDADSPSPGVGGGRRVSMASVSGGGGGTITVSLYGYGGTFNVAPISAEAFEYWSKRHPDELAEYVTEGPAFNALHEVPEDARFMGRAHGAYEVPRALEDEEVWGLNEDRAHLRVTLPDGRHFDYEQLRDLGKGLDAGWDDIFLGYSDDGMWRMSTENRSGLEPGTYLLIHVVEKGLLLRKSMSLPAGEDFDERRLVFRSTLACDAMGGDPYGCDVITDVQYVPQGHDPDRPSDMEWEDIEPRTKDFFCSVIEVRPG